MSVIFLHLFFLFFFINIDTFVLGIFSLLLGKDRWEGHGLQACLPSSGSRAKALRQQQEGLGADGGQMTLVLPTLWWAVGIRFFKCLCFSH